jgi:hypothetical protein
MYNKSVYDIIYRWCTNDSEVSAELTSYDFSDDDETLFKESHDIKLFKDNCKNMTITFQNNDQSYLLECKLEHTSGTPGCCAKYAFIYNLTPMPKSSEDITDQLDHFFN